MQYRTHHALKTKEKYSTQPRGTAPIYHSCLDYAMLSIVAVLALILLVSPVALRQLHASASSISAPRAAPQTLAVGSQAHPVSTVDQDWWKRVQRDLLRYEYHPSKSNNGLQAPNRVHHLRTYFDASGIRVYDRTTSEALELVSLSLTGLGRGTILEAVEDGVVQQVGGRVEIRRESVTEWYENSPQGLEQGFTVLTRVPGDGLLVLELAVKRARASRCGEAIELVTDTGRRLRYGKLMAQDATGRTLVSRLEVREPQRVQLVVEDTQAVYPVQIDPLITGVPDAQLESNQPDPPGFLPAGLAAVYRGREMSTVTALQM